MATVDSSAFYANKGLKRTTLTLHPDTIALLGTTAKTFTKEVKITSQGEIVDVMAGLYVNDPQFKAMLDQGIKDYLDKKELKKMGRPTTSLVGTLKSKMDKLTVEEIKQIERLLASKE